MRHAATINGRATSNDMARRQTLSALQDAVAQAERSLCVCQMLTYKTRNDLLHCSHAFKATIDAAGDEQIYDLAALLDLVVLTAFGSRCETGAGGLKLLANCTVVLNKSVDGDTSPEASERECTAMVEHVWNWLGNSNGLPSKI